MTKMLPPEIKQAIPVPPEDAHIAINVGLDGVWLHFTSAMGLQSSINVGNLAVGGHINSAALAQWCLDRQEQACDIYALLPEEARATPHDHLKREHAMKTERLEALLVQNLDAADRLTGVVERLTALVTAPNESLDDNALTAAGEPQPSGAEPDLTAQPSSDAIDREYERPCTPAAEPGPLVTESNPD